MTVSGEARSGVEVMCVFFLSGSGQDAGAEQDCSALLLCGGAVRVVLQVETGWIRWKRSDSTKKGLASFKTGAAQCRAPRILFA